MSIRSPAFQNRTALPNAVTEAVTSLQAAGFLTEWTEAEGEGDSIGWPDDEDECLISVLERYYLGYDGSTQSMRILEDRFFLYRLQDGSSAPSVIRKLVSLVPDLDGATLDKIGSDLLVVRFRDQHVAVIDEGTDDGILVRALVHAVNGLLAQQSIDLRFVPVAGDGAREVYLGADAGVAKSLFACGLVDVDDEEELLDFIRS